ncbi:MAG: undecaprenyl-diphosphate phosphatase [Candidatus Komeilibacteria bacterium]|nr:undecaprenyl-diphosphate phosphatase [Candidatus Komeilibacteria bacterium]
MTAFWSNVFLGVIQGVTEWLPISSSGHLALGEYLIGFRQDLAYDVFLHIGSLAVMLAYFRRDIFKLCISLTHRERRSDHRLMGFIILATLITIPIALLLDPVEPALRLPAWLAAGFALNAIALAFTRNTTGERGTFGWGSAAFLGLLQGIAVVPSVSRSGLTIGAALLMGIRPEDAFRFSFLMAIPSIAGAIIYKVKDLAWNPEYLVGLFATVIAGYASLWLLEKIVMRDRLHWFWIYNAFLAIVLLYA